MEKRNIALIGFRATGKSLVGKLLARKLGLVFVDMDDRLTTSFGREINCWVKLHGWDSFRDAESELLESLAAQDGLVLSTGGGVVLRPENRDILKKHFSVVWLTAKPETIQARLTGDPKSAAQRPPLTGLPLEEEIEKLLKERKPFYEDASDLTLSTDDCSAEKLAEEIEKRLH